MARKPREFHIGGVYHVIQRGVEKRKIFLKNQDYSRFILGLELFNFLGSTNLWSLIARAGSDPARAMGTRLKELRGQRAKRSSRLVELMAFTLMPNHLHLLLREEKRGGVSAFMQKMGGYATYFNQQYDRSGSLFQSRYRLVPVETDTQLRAIFAYVHTNPVGLWESGWKDFLVRDSKAALRTLEEYRWSSYGDYIGKVTFPQATQREFFSNLFGGVRGCREAVEDWVKFKAQRTPLDPDVILE